MALSSDMINQQKVLKVRAVVSKAGDDLRQRYPILQRQNLIGASILILAWIGIITASYAYAYQHISAWLCIPLVAFFASLTHELEHDLIHYMYFKKTPWAHHLMLALVWLARPNTIHPWARRRLHLNHHKYSGSIHDLEERGIGNGMSWGIKRILVMSDQLMTIYLRPLQMFKMITLFLEKQPEKERKVALILQLIGFFPLGFIYYGLCYIFVIYHVGNMVAALFGLHIAWSSILLQAIPWINFLAVIWLIPNFIRSFSLQFISSNMHYYGDIDSRDVIKQTQVLTVWWLTPLQLFCCNFGATHAIHHFVVKEPFYIRHMTSKIAHQVMKEVGVRFNDVGTFKRMNRWH
ncbi:MULTISPECIES: fatty acid desaturase [unclassified Acinetobacter]|uniref:fatty acid desaturase n=1 Tax=unclassified Acinetobacter TaxID=196816 RepID=UPI00293456AF|nr:MULTISPECIES: fatty acid desaturase [unclassified Acinetobacter]WOE32114.1 fatty acid desaturase [Acinetobacter sp. SAAs470]WOE37583.1 fatty acid desaturase [Acinetobacter sp. SAAs474]